MSFRPTMMMEMMELLTLMPTVNITIRQLTEYSVDDDGDGTIDRRTAGYDIYNRLVSEEIDDGNDGDFDS